MTLGDYLAARDISDAEFAALVGVDRSSVHRMRNGKQMPSPEAMRAIAQHTSGQVQPNDFFLGEPESAAA